MFVPAKMSEVDIFVFDGQINEVAQAVARMGVMHLLDAKELGEWSSNGGGEWNGRVGLYNNQERRILDLLGYLDIAEARGLCPAGLRPAEDLALIEKDLQPIEARVNALRDTEAELERQQSRWGLVARSMERLAPLLVSIADLRQLEHLHLVAGTIPSDNIARLEASLFRIPYTIIPVHSHEGRSLVFAFCAQEHAPILDRALESAFLEPLALPEGFSGTAQQVLEQVTQRQETTRTQLAKVRQGYRTIAAEVGRGVLAMLTQVRSDRAVADAMAHFGHRGHVYLLAGWVPENKVDDLRAAVETASGGRATLEENPADVLGSKRTIPTLLRNPPLLRAVQGLVSTYGIPGYREIDPTPIVGLTFVLMFGMMFGDIGHGLFLATIGAVLAARLIPHLKGQAQIGTVLIACGLASTVFGLLYGSVFGLENVVPHIWLKPMQQIPQLLISSMALGVVILNIGFAARLATAMRVRGMRGAVFDKNGIVGLALYWTLARIVISITLGRPVPGFLFALAFLWMLALFLSEPLTNVLEKRHPLIHGNLAETMVQAFFELFEALIGYVSNTLSYVRLGAFAVAHAGLSMVVLMLADMLGSGPSMAVVRVLIIIVGNLVVIGFEGLIVAIQTLRLEYYELFGKFYFGDGVPFQPLVLPDIECEAVETL